MTRKKRFGSIYAVAFIQHKYKHMHRIVDRQTETRFWHSLNYNLLAITVLFVFQTHSHIRYFTPMYFDWESRSRISCSCVIFFVFYFYLKNKKTKSERLFVRSIHSKYNNHDYCYVRKVIFIYTITLSTYLCL